MKLYKTVSALLIIWCMASGCQTQYHFESRTTLAFALIAVIVAMFLVLAMYSNILRDEISDCDEFDQNANKLQQRQKRPLVNRSYRL